MRMEKAVVTEQDAMQEAQEYFTWEERCRPHVPEIIGQIDEWLKTGEYEKIDQICMNHDFIFDYGIVDELAYVLQAVQIYEYEKSAECSKTIFEQSDTVEQLIVYLTSARFLIWHILFETGDDAEDRLWDFLEEHQTSVWTIYQLVGVTEINRVDMMVRMACMYMDRRKLKEAGILLQGALKLSPEDESIKGALRQIQSQMEAEE